VNQKEIVRDLNGTTSAFLRKIFPKLVTAFWNSQMPEYMFHNSVGIAIAVYPFETNVTIITLLAITTM
jgi:hypothetical protein